METKSHKRSKMEVLSQSTVTNTSQDPAGSHTNFHSEFNKAASSVVNETIPEASEGEERTF